MITDNTTENDHEQVEITPEMEQEQARDEFETVMKKVTLMAAILLQDWRFYPDHDDLDAVNHLQQHLSTYGAVWKI